LKKIWFNLNIGIIGSIESFKSIFLKIIKEISIDECKTSDEGSHTKALILFDSIPIMLKVFLAENFDDLINHYKSVKNTELLLLLVDMESRENFNKLSRQKLIEINEIFLNDLNFLLIGVNSNSISNSKISDNLLIEKAKKINAIYCFKVNLDESDIIDILETILKDFIFKYKFTSPELFEKAKSYGKLLKDQINNQIET
jgi:hypothetical protein